MGSDLMQTTRVLGIAGSLRTGSTNHLLLRAAQGVAPEGMQIRIGAGVDTLPYYNPDLDSESPQLPVAELRREIESCDAILITSPEYAHGIPGVLKNALDWLVGSVEFPGKLVLLQNVSAGDARHLQAQLIEVLTTMSARVIARPPLVSAMLRRGITPEGRITDPALRESIEASLPALTAALRERDSIA